MREHELRALKELVMSMELDNSLDALEIGACNTCCQLYSGGNGVGSGTSSGGGNGC